CQVSQAPIHRLHVRHCNEQCSTRHQELPVARQDLGRIVDVLEYEAHHDDVESFLPLERLEIRLDDLRPALGRSLPEVCDDRRRTLQHYVPGNGAREQRGRKTVAQPKLEERHDIGSQFEDSLWVPVEQNGIVEVVNIVAFVCPDMRIQDIAHESLSGRSNKIALREHVAMTWWLTFPGHCNPGEATGSRTRRRN